MPNKFSSAKEAFAYAKKHGHDDQTREIASTEPGYAYAYAVDIDKCSNDITRLGACKHPYFAFFYAICVDYCTHTDTKKAVKGSIFERIYNDLPNIKPLVYTNKCK